MSVHEAISKHSNRQYQHLKIFMELDGLREQHIAEVVSKCKHNEPFTTDLINQTTTLINEHAKKGISPTRQYVSVSMVKEFVEANHSHT